MFGYVTVDPKVLTPAQRDALSGLLLRPVPLPAAGIRAEGAVDPQL